MRSELPPANQNEHADWFVETLPAADHVPRFVIRSERVPYARRVAAAIAVERPEVMRDRLMDRRHLLTKGFRYPEITSLRDIFAEVAVSRIASRP